MGPHDGFPSIPDPGEGLDGAALAGTRWATEASSEWIVLHTDLPLLTVSELEELKERWPAPGRSSPPRPTAGPPPLGRKGRRASRTALAASIAISAASRRRSIVARQGLLHDIDTFADLESAREPPAWGLARSSEVTTRFDPGVLFPEPEARAQVLGRLEAGLAAVEPEALTAAALAGGRYGETMVISIGKAAPAMARGAASVLDVVGGVCVTDHPEQVPETMSLVIGDHPVPGPASLEAGAAVLDAVRSVPSYVDIVALVSGGGSALCEAPREGRACRVSLGGDEQAHFRRGRHRGAQPGPGTSLGDQMRRGGTGRGPPDRHLCHLGRGGRRARGGCLRADHPCALTIRRRLRPSWQGFRSTSRPMCGRQ